MCSCNPGGAPDDFTVKPPSQTGFPKEVLGWGSFILTLTLPSGQHCCSSPPVNRQLEGAGALLPIVPHGSYFPFIFGNSWNLWVCWMTFQVFSSEFIYFVDTPQQGSIFWRLSPQLYLSKGVALSLYGTELNGKGLIKTVCDSYSPTVIVAYTTLFPNLYLPVQPDLAFLRMNALLFCGLLHEVLVKYLMKHLQNPAQD